MPLAFWANYNMLEELNCLSKKHNLDFSVYVDDLTFSGDQINNLFLSTVKKIVTRYSHECHPNKTKIYGKNDYKLVTGVAIKNGELIIANSKMKDIYNDMIMRIL